MRINIEIDDKYLERNIRIMAGGEEVAKKRKGKPWMVKTVSCNLCGECCKRDVREGFPHGIDPETGWCAKLKASGCVYLCTIDSFNCMTGDHSGQDHCCIKWKTLENES